MSINPAFAGMHIVRKSERGAAGAAIALWAVTLILVFVVLPFFVFGKIVPPNAIGLRQNYYGVFGLFEKGFQPGGLAPGLHWKIPGISTIVLLPRDFQYINFKSGKQIGDLNEAQLDVPTTDGSKVKTDVTLIVRYFETPLSAGKLEEKDKSDLKEADGVPLVQHKVTSHGGPRDLVLSYTTQKMHQLRTIAGKAEDNARKELSSLSTTDYYNPILREKAALHAQERTNSEVNPSGIEVWAALVRRYVYADRSIDDQIFAKNLQDQTERLNAAASLLAGAKAETERQSALWDAKIRDLEVQGSTRVDVIKSEGNLYESKKKAEGNLLLAEARAEVDRLRASALTDVAGSDVYIAREMAPLLGTLSGGVVSGIDPFNINDWIQKLTSN